MPVQRNGIILTANLTRPVLHQGKIPLAPIITSTLVGGPGSLDAHAEI
jgi:hypothetical protein